MGARAAARFGHDAPVRRPNPVLRYLSSARARAAVTVPRVADALAVVPSDRAPGDVTISVVTPVHDPSEVVLRAMLASVAAQTHTRWEHCLVDDGSSAPWVRPALTDAAARDPRVKVAFREESGGIATATNDGLALATGEFVAFLDHDDELSPDALGRMAAAIAAVADADYLYSDEDKIDAVGRHRDPFLKPAWSPDRFRCQMYTCHLSVVRRALVDELGGLRSEFDGAQDWDLVLRATERARRIVHVPEVLYHWRTLDTSVAGAGPAAKPWAYDAGIRAVEDHVRRRGVPAAVTTIERYPGMLALAPALTSRPLVSILIPTAGRRRLVVDAVRSVVERSTYDRYEIVVVADAAVDAELRDELVELGAGRLHVVPYDQPFNFADKINTGAARAGGDHLLLLNDDVEVGPADWIERLLVYGLQPGVGAVGARLDYPDGRVQHAGIIFPEGKPTNAYHQWPADTPGYYGNLLLPGDYLAVTAACLLTPRAAFEHVGGLCPQLPNNYNDVDYGLKLWSVGLRSVVVPDVRVLHHESSSRPVTEIAAAEMAFLRHRWGRVLDADPFFHPRLPDSAGFVPPVLRPDGRLGPEQGTLAFDLHRLREHVRTGGLAAAAQATVRRVKRAVGRGP